MTVEGILANFMQQQGPLVFKCAQSRAHLANQIRDRVKSPWAIRQRAASLCGPVVFMQCLAQKHPAAYAQFVVDMASKGEASLGRLKVKPSKACRDWLANPNDWGPPASADWIALASLRDSSNTFFAYDEASDQFAGITLPSRLRNWFRQTGLYSEVEESTNLLFDKSMKNFFEAVSAKKAGKQVCLFIGARLLQPAGNPKKGKFPADHWVIMPSETKILLGGKPIGTVVTNLQDPENRKALKAMTLTFDVQTWGDPAMAVDQGRKGLTLEDFLDFYYGYISIR